MFFFSIDIIGFPKLEPVGVKQGLPILLFLISQFFKYDTPGTFAKIRQIIINIKTKMQYM